MSKLVLNGVVVRVSEKTAMVNVSRTTLNKKYGRIKRTSKKYAVHDPLNSCKVGDSVAIEQCAPVSKTKFFCVRGSGS